MVILSALHTSNSSYDTWSVELGLVGQRAFRNVCFSVSRRSSFCAVPQSGLAPCSVNFPSSILLLFVN